MVRVCTYERLFTAENFLDHLKALEKVLQKITEVGLKITAEFFSLDIQKNSNSVYGLEMMG